MLQTLSLFAQTTLSDPSYSVVYPDDTAAGFGVFMLIMVLVSAVLLVAMLAGLWKIFTKAGQPGWAAIVPIYNIIVQLNIVGRPVWWLVFYFLSAIPLVGIIAAFFITIIISNDMAKSFGKDTSWTVFLVLLPFIAYPMLGFGSAQYQGPSALKPGAGAGPGAGPVPPVGPAAPTPPTPPTTPSPVV